MEAKPKRHRLGTRCPAGNVLPAQAFQPYPLFVAFLVADGDISAGDPVCVSDSSFVVTVPGEFLSTPFECAEPECTLRGLPQL